MAEHLAAFAFGTAIRVLDMSKEAQQCEMEVARVAVRMQNVLGTLDHAGGHFTEQAGLEANLLELKGVLENVKVLVGRCGPPKIPKRIKDAVLRQRNPNRQALIDAEKKLEVITQDLGLPMLTDIKQQLNRMDSESVAMANRGTEALAGMIRTEIEKAMMVIVEKGVTIKDTIDARVSRMEENKNDGGKRAPPVDRGVAGDSAKVQAVGKEEGGSSLDTLGSMVMRLGRVRFEDLKEEEILGQGAFGTVLLGTYQGREVAIKKVKGSAGSTRIMESFRKEVEIQYAMRHPNIVEVIAFDLGSAGHSPCLVMERMQESLYDLLCVEGIDMGLVAQTSVLRDVSQGMRFLHSRGILHRDLKSPNILLDDSWGAKISDFGLAKVNSTIATVTGGSGFHSKVGSDFWMAPEVHSNRKATRASDVFSLHVVMWEVLAQDCAGHGKPIGERLHTNPDARLPLADFDCPDAVGSMFRNIVDRCGHKEPSERPAMDEVCAVMSVVTDLLDDPQQILLKAATPVCRRHLQQEEGEQQRKQQTFRRQQQREKYNRDQREQQQEQQSRFMECRDAKKGLRVRATKKGAAWPPVMGIGSDVASLWSCATPVMTTRSPHNSLDESQPVSATSTEPSIVSEGSTQLVQHGSSGAQILPPFNMSDDTTKPTRDDSAVLLKLFSQCSGHSVPDSPIAHLMWFKWTGWGTNYSMKHWYGVYTRCEDGDATGTERVTRLVLPKNGLRGILPEDVMTLDSLVELDLKDNRLTGKLPSSMGNLRCLHTLDISGNKLKGTIPRELGDLVALTVLDLHGNLLTGEVPPTLGNLVRLKTLDISNCQLCGRIPEEFEMLEVLRVLRLGCNNFTGDIPYVLAKLNRLKEINIRENNFTGHILAESGSWPDLCILDMSHNLLEGRIPHELTGFTSLTTLILQRNTRIVGRIPSWIGNMTFLEEIDLSELQLGGVIPKEIGHLARLTRLSLGSCALVGSLPPELGQLRSLEHLLVRNNNFAGEIPKEIGNLTRLTRLSLDSCNLIGTLPPELGQLRSLEHLILRNNMMTGNIPRVLLKIPTLRTFHLENNQFRARAWLLGGTGTTSTIKNMLPEGCDVRL